MMKLRQALMFAAVPCLAAGIACATGDNAGDFRAGAAKVDITPRDSDLRVQGDSIRDHLFVRAIYVDNGKSCAVLVGMDYGAARNEAVGPGIAKASQETGCPVDNFVVSATHTHSSNTNGFSGPPLSDAVAAAIASAVLEAKSKLQPADIGYGTTNVYLNVNRDLYDSKGWRQAANPQAPSDKTLAVVDFIGRDHVPIAIYMNYAMHPINFFQSGVISADFPGEASRYLEHYFGDKAVAVFTQGASGDQNPKLLEMATLINVRTGGGAPPQTVGAPPPPAPTSNNYVAEHQKHMQEPVPTKDVAAYKDIVAREGELVRAEGVIIAESAIDVMRNHTPTTASSGILWGGDQKFTCPGRDRLDADDPARENVFPGYKDGAPVNLDVGLLRLGEINLVRVNGEVYNIVSQRLKQAAPANKTMMVTLANGMANSGYIYSDDASSHLTFQVIGSRLKPGCAERKIIDTALDLMHRSGE